MNSPLEDYSSVIHKFILCMYLRWEGAWNQRTFVAWNLRSCVKIGGLELFSIECRKTKTKPITADVVLANLPYNYFRHSIENHSSETFKSECCGTWHCHSWREIIPAVLNDNLSCGMLCCVLQYHVYSIHRQDTGYLGLWNRNKNQKVKRPQFIRKQLFSFKKRSTVHCEWSWWLYCKGGWHLRNKLLTTVKYYCRTTYITVTEHEF